MQENAFSSSFTWSFRRFPSSTTEEPVTWSTDCLILLPSFIVCCGLVEFVSEERATLEESEFRLDSAAHPKSSPNPPPQPRPATPSRSLEAFLDTPAHCPGRTGCKLAKEGGGHVHRVRPTVPPLSRELSVAPSVGHCCPPAPTSRHDPDFPHRNGINCYQQGSPLPPSRPGSCARTHFL